MSQIYRLIRPGADDDLVRLLEEWRTRRQAGSAPDRSTWTVDQLAPWLPRLLSLELDGDGLRVRAAGSLTEKVFGQRLTGARVADIPLPARDAYAEVLDKGEPLVARTDWNADGQSYRLTQLILPVTLNGAPQLLVAVYTSKLD